MRFEWKYSKQTEIDRLIFTASNIARGYYQKLGFYLTQSPKSNHKDLQVIFPIPTISPKTWKELTRSELECGNIIVNDRVKEDFQKSTEGLEILKSKEESKLRKQWREIEPKLEKLLQAFYPEIVYKKLIISPTLYGTIGSYRIDGNNVVHISFRVGSGTKNIVNTLLTALVQYQSLPNKAKDDTDEIIKHNLWHQKQAIAEYLVKFTAFKEISDQNINSIALQSTEIPPELVKESNEYYARLGFPAKKSLSLDKGNVQLRGEKLDNLTMTQQKILRRLLENENEIISFDEIAEVMWKDDSYEKFSLSAMSKMIFQIREKLRNAGLQKEVIFTKRGRGYVLIQ